ncbi:MAG: hypothetical protein ACK5P7_02580 [Bdellovibrio sp.]
MPRQRQGAYRQSFFKPEDMRQFWQQHHLKLKALRSDFERGLLSEAELVGAFLLQVWHWARPKSWSNGPRAQRAGEALVPQTSPLWSVQQLRMRGLPPEFADILIGWHFGQIPLTLYFSIPDADHVLLSQTQGARCVSLLIQDEEQFIAGGEHRDSFSFALHDLIHASHFFGDPSHYRRQVFFSRLMQSLNEHPELGRLKNTHPKFAGDLDYLTSDMNTHWIHSLKCLKSLFTREDVGHFPLETEVQRFLALQDHKSRVRFSLYWNNLNTQDECEATRQDLHQLLENLLRELDYPVRGLIHLERDQSRR